MKNIFKFFIIALIAGFSFSNCPNPSDITNYSPNTNTNETQGEGTSDLNDGPRTPPSTDRFYLPIGLERFFDDGGKEVEIIPKDKLKDRLIAVYYKGVLDTIYSDDDGKPSKKPPSEKGTYAVTYDAVSGHYEVLGLYAGVLCINDELLTWLKAKSTSGFHDTSSNPYPVFWDGYNNFNLKYVTQSLNDSDNKIFVDLELSKINNSIDDNTFSNCTKITGITIPETVKNIGEKAFNGCTNLTKVTFKGTIPEAAFKSDAFNNNLKTKFYENNSNGTPGTYKLNGLTWELQP
jgi:hypothetical protein